MPTANPMPASIADHPVLDMLNTVASVNGQPHDFWQADEDVSAWLMQAGWGGRNAGRPLPARRIAGGGGHLREVIRTLVQARKAGKRAHPDALNVFLRRAQPPGVGLAGRCATAPGAPASG